MHSARADGLHRGRDAAVAREHDDHARRIDGVGRAVRHAHVETAIVKGFAQASAEYVVVVDDEHRALGAFWFVYHAGLQGLSMSRGTIKRATVPPPGRAARTNSPPIFSANARAKNTPRPRPRPGALVVKNGSPTRLLASAGMPGPESKISNAARSASI